MAVKLWLTCLFCAIFAASLAQGIARLEVGLNSPASNVPVKTDLDAITFLPDSVLRLEEVLGTKRIHVPFQIENADHRILHWVVEPGNNKALRHVYELVKGAKNFDDASIKTMDEDGSLTIQYAGKNLLRYNYKTVYPPAGIDTAYKRSGFIHPLWSPHGQVLTRIQAPDHYHHYGIWNPWTHVLYESDTVDFWNLADRKGTVRFANLVSISDGPIFSEYRVLHQHVVFKKNGSEKIALNELQSVRIYQPRDPTYYITDITINMSCAGESPVMLLEYRYGGLGWRTTGQWNKENSEVLTSEGKTRKDADGSTARWCIVQGAVDNDFAGMVMMSYPANYNHPEPLRIWPETQNNRGDMFANFSPTKNRNWLLEPGHVYTLKYRLIVFNGHFTKEKAESAWKYFAYPAKVIVK